MKIASGKNASTALMSIIKETLNEIYSLSEEDVKKTTEAGMIEKYIAKCGIAPVSIDLNDMSVVAGSISDIVLHDNTLRKLIRIRVPFTGNFLFLEYVPSTHLVLNEEITKSDNAIIAELWIPADNEQSIQQAINTFRENLNRCISYLNDNLRSFQATATTSITTAVHQKYTTTKLIVEALENAGIPIKEY